jgi:hypothetical protein
MLTKACPCGSRRKIHRAGIDPSHLPIMEKSRIRVPSESKAKVGINVNY